MIQTFSSTAAVVRYLVRDVERSSRFYVEQLGFRLDRAMGTVIAFVSRGDLHIILSGPTTSGARPLADGREQTPGGYNRIVLYVDDIEARVAALRGASVALRGEIESGPGGKQIVIDDPDGNPIELHEAPRQG